MFIKRTAKIVAGKQYVNHLLVESITTKAGPRHRLLAGKLVPGATGTVAGLGASN